MKHISDETFDACLRAPRPVLVDFVAPWCPPCDAMRPTLEALARERTDLDIVSVDVDESPDLAARFGVRAMPTLLLFRDGQAVAQVVGAQSRPRLEAWLADKLR